MLLLTWKHISVGKRKSLCPILSHLSVFLLTNINSCMFYWCAALNGEWCKRWIPEKCEKLRWRDWGRLPRRREREKGEEAQEGVPVEEEGWREGDFWEGVHEEEEGPRMGSWGGRLLESRWKEQMGEILKCVKRAWTRRVINPKRWSK